jgi:uncharacterized cupin superfamily protein
MCGLKYSVVGDKKESFGALMSQPVLIPKPAEVELEPERIPPGWILSGSPEARGRNLVRSRDWAARIVAWDCTAGQFVWHYSEDEVIIVVSGDAVLLQDNGQERRFGPGDVAFFPAGTSAKWRVDHYISKIAILREPMWRPMGFALKAFNTLLRRIGLARKSALVFVAGIAFSCLR